MDNRVKQFVRRLSNQNKSQETLRVYQIALKQFFEFIGARGLPEARESVERFLNSLEDLSVSTQKLYYTALRSYYKFIRKYFIYKVEYSFRKKMQNEERYFQNEEVKKIIKYFEDRSLNKPNYSNKRNEVCIKLSLLTGSRPSELINLDMADIKINDHHINLVFRNTKTKTDRIFPIVLKSDDPKMQQVVAVNQVVKKLIAGYFTVRGEFMKRKNIKDKNAFLYSNKGNRLSYLQLWKVFINAIEVMGLRGSPHWMRHTMITRKLIEGNPVIGVSKLVGHSTPYTIYKNYTHASERLLDKISYNNLFGEGVLI